MMAITSSLQTRSLVMALSACIGCTSVAASEADRGHIALSYQYIRVDGFESSIGELDIGTTDTHTFSVEVDYKLTDRVSVSVGVPLVTKRYRGGGPHVPSSIIPPQDDQFIDDGDYHTEVQDISFGVRYLLTTSPLTIEPFLFYGVPSHDYPHFAHAAVGQNLWRVEAGASFTYLPPLSDFYFRLAPSYTFMEETFGVSIDHWRVHGEVGYLLKPGVSARVFALVKEGDGLDFPEDFPPPRNTEFWFQHDRMVRHNYVNMGAGVDWQFSERTALSFSALTMVEAEQVHKMDYAFTVGLSRSF
ncbi:MAG: transporter [Gammaproteobacteria bacterium]|nr:transporter [Gammaproteobacteria bacterium]